MNTRHAADDAPAERSFGRRLVIWLALLLLAAVGAWVGSGL